MPRPAINNYIFYKIVNINGDIDLCYVGSTCNWKQRHQQHKVTCNCEKYNNYNCKLYKTIREHGGWNEFRMIEIARVEQLTLTQARQKEEEYRIELKANMNTLKCFSSKEEKMEYKHNWYVDNFEKNKERNKQHRADNADSKREYDKQYRIDNADKKREYHKQYAIDNADKINQWRIDNADRKKEVWKQYRINNADKIKEKRCIKQTCECGGRHTHGHLSAHLKTKMHQNYLKSLTENQVIV